MPHKIGEGGRRRNLGGAMDTAMDEVPKNFAQKKNLNHRKGLPERKVDDFHALQLDVASFASELGFSTAAFGSGFDDAEFRKTGRGAARRAGKVSEGGSSLEEEKSVGEINGKLGWRKAGQKRRMSGDLEIERHVGKKRITDDAAKAKSKEGRGIIDSEVDRKPIGNVDRNGKKASDNTRNSSGKFAFKRKRSVNSVSDGYNTKQQKSGEMKKVRKEVKKEAMDNLRMFPKASSLLSSGLWYDSAAEVAASLFEASGTLRHSEAPLKQDGGGDSADLLERLRKDGELLMERVATDYERSRGKDSDIHWVMVARRSGTTADKVAALTVLLQDNPVANLRALDALLGMITLKGGKRHATIGIDALKELFLTSLLPDRKLRYLRQQPLYIQRDVKDGWKLLIFWYWEDCLKCRYERFVIALEEAMRDNLPFLKDKAVKTVFELLKSKPEQERRLLSALVNKLGDPDRKVASNASYFLSGLLAAHPNMKMVVVEEVDLFIFRPHVGLRSTYHAVAFLNQIVLSNKGDGPKLAKRLMDLYFGLFQIIIFGKEKEVWQKKGPVMTENLKAGEQVGADADVAIEMDSRLLSALLTGVNRAFPFVIADEADTLIEKHTPVLFKLVHSKSFNVGVQALMLLYQLLLKSQAVSDRFYRALYSVLLSPSLFKASKVEMFLGLLFKAMKSDIDSKRMAAFSKRLLQVALHQPAQLACGCLLVLSEVLKARPSLWNRVLQPEDEDEEIEHFKDILEETVADTITSCDQRDGTYHIGQKTEMLERSDMDGEELTCLLPDLGDADDSNSEDKEEDQHRQMDRLVKTDDMNIWTPGNRLLLAVPNKQDNKNEYANADVASNQIKKVLSSKSSYNPRHRNPSFCNADQACWWELTALASHVHPSVATMSRTLLSGTNILYSGNPLKDLALGVFLDRYSEKKPKSRKREGYWHGSSQLAPSREDTVLSILPVGADFLQLSEKDVAPEDIVFHKFYMSKPTSRKRRKQQKEVLNDELTAADGYIDGQDEYLGGNDETTVADEYTDDSDKEVDFLEQVAGQDMDTIDDALEYQNDYRYNYDKFERAFELANNETGLEEDESEGDMELISLEEIDSDFDTAEVVGGSNYHSREKKKLKSRNKKFSSKRRKMDIIQNQGSNPSTFASLEEYSHVLDGKAKTEFIKSPTSEGGQRMNRKKYRNKETSRN